MRSSTGPAELWLGGLGGVLVKKTEGVTPPSPRANSTSLRTGARPYRTDITSPTGITLICPAPEFSHFVRYRRPRRSFFTGLAGKNLGRDHRCRTKPEKSGAGSISAVPVVEVISVVIPAADLRVADPFSDVAVCYV